MTDEEKFKFISIVAGAVTTVVTVSFGIIYQRFTGRKELKQIKKEHDEIKNEFQQIKQDRAYDKLDVGKLEEHIRTLESHYEIIIQHAFRLFGVKGKN